MSEFSPPGSNAHMTPTQIKKYMREMKKAQAIADAKIKKAESSGELEKEKEELKNLEDILDNL
ncbi:hypothetical protein A9Q91_00500 [Candidatus Gracilibacteria bacterium 28_42_T64]|nr:hypothetical protein A9Q91_00500 [Candidatus Gracilibacteria bacterium 28_42_T64]